jgi:predicted phosphodiesterase
MADLKFLALTDLHHASESNYLDDPKIKTPSATRHNVFDDFHNILENALPDEPFDLIPVTGDLTTAGQAEGLERFDKETWPLLLKRVPNAKQICIVPGNHDVAWRLDPGAPDYLETKFAPFLRSLKQAKASSCLIPKGNVLGRQLATHPESPDPIYVDHRKRLIVICINSAIRCGEVNSGVRKELTDPLNRALGSANGSVSTNVVKELESIQKLVEEYTLFDIAHATTWQLNVLLMALSKLKKELGPDWSQYFRVCLLHHHVLPFPREVTEIKPFELMVDASNVVDTLNAADVDLVLTGHKHQPYSFVYYADGRQMVVAGGPTVGGYPANSPRGFRYITITDRERSAASVSIWDIPCDPAIIVRGGLPAFLREHRPQRYLLHSSTQKIRVAFPEQVFRAINEQLSENPFFKEEVFYRLNFEESNDGNVQIVTEYSYKVVNRTDQPQTWDISYTYKYGSGQVHDLRYNDSAIDDYVPTAAGISAKRVLEGGMKARVFMKVQEEYRKADYELYTGTCPSRDLRVAVKDPAKAFEFSFENFSAGGQAPVRTKTRFGQEEVFLNNGLLPFQGIKLSWRSMNGKRKTTAHRARRPRSR